MEEYGSFMKQNIVFLRWFLIAVGTNLFKYKLLRLPKWYSMKNNVKCMALISAVELISDGKTGSARIRHVGKPGIGRLQAIGISPARLPIQNIA